MGRTCTAFGCSQVMVCGEVIDVSWPKVMFYGAIATIADGHGSADPLDVEGVGTIESVPEKPDLSCVDERDRSGQLSRRVPQVRVYGAVFLWAKPQRSGFG